MLEGAAKELMALPIVGRLVIIVRGVQRPVWGFGTLYLDIKVFSGDWPINPNSMQEWAFFAVNILVLSFLFGERAVKNLASLIAQIWGARKA